jgi:phosphatidylglycerophosphatase A
MVALPAPWWFDLLVAAAAIAVSMWATAPEAGDPGWMAIDEVAGTLVAMIGLTGVGWVVGVVVARMADIFKVAPGVAAAERLPSPWGVTADDVVAGLYGLAAGWLVTGLL